MTNPKQALKMAYRVPCTIKPPQTWQAEHKIRQYRLISAIDADLMSEQTAEMFDAFDNFLRFTWVNACPVCLLSTN
jgi:hypothetical protein